MTVLQAVALVLVAAGGGVVALTRDPLKQVVALSLYGLLLAVLFFVVQAPDVALSQLTVGMVALPAMLLLALHKLAERR